MNAQTVSITREELFKLIWEESAQKLAKRFNLSDVGLAKVCKRHKIPRPPRGYWAKISAGQKPPKTKLLDVDDPRLENVTFLAADGSAAIEEKSEPPEIAAIIDFESAPENQIIVVEELTSLHPLLKVTRSSLKENKYDRYPRLQTNSANTLDIAVHKTSKQRALRILNTLFKSLSARGHPIRFDKSKGKGVVIELFGEALELSMREPMKRIDYTPTKSELAKKKRGEYVYMPRYEFSPTGELVLGADASSYNTRGTVKDTKTLKLEDRLNEFIVKAVREAYKRREWRLKCEENERLWELARKRQKEIEARLEEEERRRALLISEAEKYDQATKIRAYIKSVEEKAARWPGSEELRRYLEWANNEADRLDPTVNGYTEVNLQRSYTYYR